MELLTKELKEKFKKIWSQDWKGEEAIVIAKFFTPYNQWTWLATEYDPKSKTFFWLVKGEVEEYGYFSLKEFEEINKRSEIPLIERDIYWKEMPIKEARKYL